jgi:hypothetical protein
MSAAATTAAACPAVACATCATAPGSHSFVHFGNVRGVDYFYTAPARASLAETPDVRIANFKKHLDSAKGRPWVWIFDCGGMEMKHAMSVEHIRRLTAILIEEHADVLQRLVIVRPTIWVQGMVTLMRQLVPAALGRRLEVVDGGKLEQLVALERIGLHGAPLGWLNGVLTSS